MGLGEHTATVGELDPPRARHVTTVHTRRRHHLDAEDGRHTVTQRTIRHPSPSSHGILGVINVTSSSPSWLRCALASGFRNVLVASVAGLLGLRQQLGASLRHLQEVPAPIVGITPAGDEPAPLELVDDPDEDRRVDGEAAGDVLLGQRLGGRERQHQELTGVESDRAERIVERLLGVDPGLVEQIRRPGEDRRGRSHHRQITDFELVPSIIGNHR